ncbi:hypothetical protein CASFOL_039546 [Castilleja foliolosa]|uniref:Uncharacterized protein n=1 Tax=Castilleja foliolosa TaxID=1961234 RepID=A0ABD3BIN2_9LAMI
MGVNLILLRNGFGLQKQELLQSIFFNQLSEKISKMTTVRNSLQLQSEKENHHHDPRSFSRDILLQHGGCWEGLDYIDDEAHPVEEDDNMGENDMRFVQDSFIYPGKKDQ